MNHRTNNPENFSKLTPEEVNTQEFQSKVIDWTYEYKDHVDDILNNQEDEMSSSKIDNKLEEKDSQDPIYYVPGLEYSESEIKNIDEVMWYVNRVDRIISEWHSFSNTIDYNLFVLWYDKLSWREKLYFKEIYHDLRVRYLLEKIDKNLKVKNNPKEALSHYVREMQILEPEFDYWFFYSRYENAKNDLEIVFDKLSKEKK